MVSRWGRWLVAAWSVLLAVVMLGPALGWGYVLSYDMVWVPDLAMRSDFWGLGSALPRAVPSDLVVALADEVIPGMLLQKLVLVGALTIAGLGAGRLAPTDSIAGRLTAVSVYVWNPFVAQRLLIGHWPVLIGYALLPWILLAARQTRVESRVAVRLLLFVPLGALSASAGIISATVLLSFGLRRRAGRTNAYLLLLASAANAPWLMAGLIHAGSATLDRSESHVFALSSAGFLPAPVAALGLGGIWNAEVLLPSQTHVAAAVLLVAVLVLAALGLRPGWRAWGSRDSAAFAACWLVGWVVAVATWATPALVGSVVATVPGAGVFRDGARALALCAPLTAALAGYGAARAAALAGSLSRPAAWGAAAATVLVPLAAMPDAAFGESGRLSAVDYPASYAAARVAVARTPVPGDVLVLPFTSYRAPPWNGGRKVLDPLGRYLTRNYVASDVLSVSGVRLPSDDPRVRAVEAALSRTTPQARSRALRRVGIGVAVTDSTVPGAAPALAGRSVRSPLPVVALGRPVQRTVPTSWARLMAGAWAAYAAVLVLGVALVLMRYGDIRKWPSRC